MRDLRDFLTHLELQGILLAATVRPADLEGYLAALDCRGLRAVPVIARRIRSRRFSNGSCTKASFVWKDGTIPIATVERWRGTRHGGTAAKGNEHGQLCLRAARVFQPKALTLTADAVSVTVEPMDIWLQNAEVLARDVGTVKIWWWRRNAEIRVRGVAVSTLRWWR